MASLADEKPPLDFSLEADSGWRIRDGKREAWRGWRVRYRRRGARRWRTFVLDDSNLSLEAVEAAIAKHEGTA